MDKENVGCIYMYMIYIYNGILFSHKKEWNSAICSNMDGPRDYHTKWSKPKTNIIRYRLYVEYGKKDTNELIYKTKIDP